MARSPERDRNRDADLGGADAVNDTPGVAGRGTTPGDVERRGEQRAGGTGGRGLPVLGWIAIVLALLLIAAYGLGLFRLG
ncbi:MAG TPA: hypothetical protein VMM18_02760 [Gemmatimonadaceae bacterium]|nr:hypothetical protein [Gemmatimonadaceae bacterium]